MHHPPTSQASGSINFLADYELKRASRKNQPERSDRLDILKLFDDCINDYFVYPLCRSWSCRVPEEQDDDLEWEIVSDGKTKRTARS